MTRRRAPVLVVVAYDVTDDARRDRVGQALLNLGDRVQKSVFECRVTIKELGDLRRRLEALVDVVTDSVRFYSLCGRCGDLIAAIPEEESRKPRVLVL